MIENQSNRLTADEKELLLYQNDARINSFLFFFGRITKKLPPASSYFRFVNDINNNTKWTKSLPHNLLYKHEINYLINYDSQPNMNAFLSYIESQTSNKDLLAFLKAIYIREIIEKPFYWERHQALFDSEILKATLLKEKENPYYDLIQRSSDNYFSSQKGVVAYDFTSERIDGTKLRLSDLKGKIVFIDTWASWCGPCISERPNVLELANRFKDNPRVEILMISVDASRDDWIKYLTKMNQLGNHGDVIIENGMRTKYGDSFNVKFIPKYILIDGNGVIIDSDIPGPSKAVVDLIEKELKSM
jgi:thiol-disulfide isomerase/thioredoxin